MSGPTYHAGMRQLQDRFDTRRLADRLDERLGRSTFRDDDRAFIESRTMFFIATADAEGRPDCSYKGGDPGFVRVTAGDELVFPDYDGNGMFKSLGNLAANPHVGLLFIAMGERPQRLRVNGRAEVVRDDAAMAQIPGAQMLVKVTPTDIFPNCPRYIPRMTLEEASPYAPVAGTPRLEPKWKAFPDFADVVPPRRA